MLTSNKLIDELRRIDQEINDNISSRSSFWSWNKRISTVSSLAAVEYTKFVGVNTVVIEKLKMDAISLLDGLKALEDELTDIGDISSEDHQVLQILARDRQSLWGKILIGINIFSPDMKSVALSRIDDAVREGIQDLGRVIWWLDSARADLSILRVELSRFPSKSKSKQQLRESIEIVVESVRTLRVASKTGTNEN